MSDDFLGFDFDQDFDGGDTGEGMAINFAYSVACWAAKRAFRFGKQHFPKAQSTSANLWGKASHSRMAATAGNLLSKPVRLVQGEVRAFLGIREPVRSSVAGFIAFYGAVIVWDHYAYPAEIPQTAMMAFGAYFMVILGIIGYGMARAAVRRLRTPRGPTTA